MVTEKRASLTWCKVPVNRSGPQKGTKRTAEQYQTFPFYIALWGVIVGAALRGRPSVEVCIEWGGHGGPPLQIVLRLYILHLGRGHKQVVDSIQVAGVEEADLNLAFAAIGGLKYFDLRP